MSWSNFKIKTVYDDEVLTPIENAFVYVRFKNSNTNTFSQEVFTGYTNQNGIITVTSTQETTNYQIAVYRCFDEVKFLQEGDLSSTIVNNTTYDVFFDIDGAGIKFYTFHNLFDVLYATITYAAGMSYGEKLITPKQTEIYTKNLNGTYTLYNTVTANTVSFNNYFHTTELRLKIYRSNGDLLYMKDISYKNAMFGGGGGPFLCDDYYDIKLPLVNDTIDWHDSGITLINVDFELTLSRVNGASPQTVTFTSTSSNMYLHESLYENFSNIGTAYFLNLTDPELNTIKASKNHYNDTIEGLYLSATTNNGDFSEYVFILSGGTVDTPIILEREPNVCMTNKDLYDYLISLTELRPDLSEEYEPNRVGISDTWFTYLWSDSIKRYLDPEYQIITPDTVENFKNVFVNQLSTTRVSTLYTSPSSIENNYTLDKLHGYVWDRCFIPEEKEFVENCLTFSIGQNESCDISFNYMPGPRTLFDFEYSTNNGVTWNSYSFVQSGIGETISLSPGGNTSVKFRRALSNTGTTLSTSPYYFYYFSMIGTCSSTGCVNSLLDGYGLSTTEITSEYCFSKLFNDCVGLRSAPELPATTLTHGCYYQMFKGCTSLTMSPALPATTLTEFCYYQMFLDCTSLAIAPELPATTLASACYSDMFFGCTSLTTAPELPATILASSCYSDMFRRCTSLTTAPALPATTLASSCYSDMFFECTSLTTAPELPATILDGACYAGMFWGCTSLTNVQSTLPATALAVDCYANMFGRCTSLTTAPLLPATTLTKNCYKAMFTGCTSLTNAKTLSSATVLNESCFEDMFYGCTSLSVAPTISRSPGMQKNCFKNMFHGCTSLTTMPYTGSTFPWQSHAYGCYEGMFQNCTSLRNTPSTIFGYNARDYCFKRMFAGCTSITNPIRLYANNLGSLSGVCESMFEGCTSLMSGRTTDSLVIGQDCYKNMFKNCGKLVCIEAKFTGTTSGNFTMQNASAYTYNWVYGVSNAGTFYHKNETPGTPGGYGVHWIPNGWEAQLLA